MPQLSCPDDYEIRSILLLTVAALKLFRKEYIIEPLFSPSLGEAPATLGRAPPPHRSSLLDPVVVDRAEFTGHVRAKIRIIRACTPNGLSLDPA